MKCINNCEHPVLSLRNTLKGLFCMKCRKHLGERNGLSSLLQHVQRQEKRQDAILVHIQNTDRAAPCSHCGTIYSFKRLIDLTPPADRCDPRLSRWYCPSCGPARVWEAQKDPDWSEEEDMNVAKFALLHKKWPLWQKVLKDIHLKTRRRVAS